MALQYNSHCLASFLIVLSILGEFVTEAMGELCMYKKSVYNIYTSSYDKRIASMECQWGCCNHHNSPCCSAPISLIVGCVIGGVILFSIIIVSICCCVFCRRGINHHPSTNTNTTSMRFSINRDPSSISSIANQNHLVLQSEISTSSNSGQGHTQNIDDLPPSYEEVMRGETNEGFKPDSI